jgi:hypothetical protein
MKSAVIPRKFAVAILKLIEQPTRPPSGLEVKQAGRNGISYLITFTGAKLHIGWSKQKKQMQYTIHGYAQDGKDVDRAIYRARCAYQYGWFE